MSQGVSIADIVRAGQLDPVAGERALASAPTTGIAEHVLRAHEAAVARTQAKPQGRVTAEITWNPDIGAFELVAESREAREWLQALGVGAKVSIQF